VKAEECTSLPVTTPTKQLSDHACRCQACADKSEHISVTTSRLRMV